MKQRKLSVFKRGLNFETQMWIFTRLSALAMYALALVAIIGALVMGARTQMNIADLMRWAFTPNVTHVQNSDVLELAPWAGVFWKLAASLFVFIAASHGLHGLVAVLDDYLVRPGQRKVVRIVIIPLLLLLSAAGIYIIWTSVV